VAAGLSRVITDKDPAAAGTGTTQGGVAVTSAPQTEDITGVILAGGRARRMGGIDKGLASFGNRPLIEWVIDALRPQVGHIMINANRSQTDYARYGYPVFADAMADFQGPLAGFSSALARIDTPWMLSLPCDGPYPAPDLATRLAAALIEQQAELAVASDGERLQPVYALIPRHLASSLDAFLGEGERKIDRWYARHRLAVARFDDRPDAFANINSLVDAERLLGGGMHP